MSQRDCLRCQSPMQIGYMLDRTENTRYAMEWVEGAPKKRFLTAGVKRAPSLPVVAYRCSGCNMLELVAPNPDDVESGQLSVSGAAAGKGALSTGEQ